MRCFLLICLLGKCLSLSSLSAGEPDQPWTRHTIDDSSRGADGVRLADVNGDGLLEIATGWEEGGRIRLYLNPGPQKAAEKWPAVTVGKVRSPEDAVLVDLDGDGAVDVVSSCEGRERTLFVHWAPTDTARRLEAAAWKTQPLPASRDMTSWMFALPLQIDGRHGPDLLAGSKAGSAQIGWWQAPANPRDLDAWRWRSLYRGGWIMSLVSEDMDSDGDLDVLATDRRGEKPGCLWLENPGQRAIEKDWPLHYVGPTDKQVMFLDTADLDQDGLQDVLVATRSHTLFFQRRKSKDGREWESFPIQQPSNSGTGKSVRAGDINGDGRMDLVFSCENASGGKSGVMWLSYTDKPSDPNWTAHEISGPEGGKFDLVQLLDLDEDGDLDVLTCEERDNLGVIWYENPTK